MKRWTSLALSLCMTLAFSPSGLMAKGGRGQGGDPGRGHGKEPTFTQNSNGNGQGTIDRDFGTDRAREVGRGKKKGLYKDQYSIGDGRDKDRSHDSHKKDKDKVKKLHKDKKDKDRSNN
jgi:hypothetical protein